MTRKTPFPGKLVWAAMLAALVLLAAAPVEADVSFNHAHLRVIQLVADVEAASVALEDGTTVLTNLTPGTMSDYMNYPVNRSTFLRIGITPVSGISSVMEQPVPPLAGGYHSVVLVGSALDSTLELLFIDEDRVCERWLAQGSCIILVNNIKGSPPLTFIAENPVIDDARYRRAVVNHVPAGSYRDFIAVDLTNPETRVFVLQPGFFEPNAIYFYGLSGTYPGAMFVDYSLGSTRRVPVDIMTFLRGLIAERQLTDGARLFATENIVFVLEESGLQFLLGNSLLNYTVFAPIDRAGFDIPTSILECAIENPQAIRSLILNHILSGGYDSNQLIEAGQVETMAGTTLRFIPTEGGDGFFIDNKVRVDNALGYSTVNGNVYLVDTVLIPEGFEAEFCEEAVG